MKNCTGISTPVSSWYLQNVSTWTLVAIILAAFVSAVIVGIYMEELWFFYKHRNSMRQLSIKAVLLLGIYPVFSVTACVGLFVPRSQEINDLVASLYLSFCMYIFLKMMEGHYGGDAHMLRTLANYEFQTASPPCCCCCVCLPKVPVTRLSMYVVELFILQNCILKPFLIYIATVIYADSPDLTFSNIQLPVSYNIINVFNSISAIFAIYGFAMMYRVSAGPLQEYLIKPKYFSLQLVIVFSNLQRIPMTILVATGVIKCDWPLSSKANAEKIYHLLIIVEMLVLAIMARIYYRRNILECAVSKPERRLTIIEDGLTDTSEVYGGYGSTAEVGNAAFSNAVTVTKGGGVVNNSYEDLDGYPQA